MAKTIAKKKQALEICFTIMPFGVYFDAYYENIYKVAIENCGLESRRADDLFRPSSIVSDIWTLTKKAKIILADLSGKNPNVFYELGLAHAITKPAILVAESMDDIPFDLRGLRIIVYNKNEHNWGTELQRKIEKAIKEILEAPDEAIPITFLNVKGVKKAEVTPEEKEVLQLKRDLELLTKEVRALTPPTDWAKPVQVNKYSLVDLLRKEVDQQQSRSLFDMLRNEQPKTLRSKIIKGNTQQGYGGSDTEKKVE